MESDANSTEKPGDDQRLVVPYKRDLHGTWVECEPGDADVVMYQCKCGHSHQIAVKPLEHFRHVWSWNNDVMKPTLHPSIKADSGDAGMCHHFVVEGKIQFCSDTTHEDRGNIIPMVPFYS